MRIEQIVFVICLLHVGILIHLDLTECNIIVGVLLISHS